MGGGGGGAGRGMGRRRESVSPFTKHGCVCITSPLRVTCYIRLQDTNSFEGGWEGTTQNKNFPKCCLKNKLLQVHSCR